MSSFSFSIGTLASAMVDSFANASSKSLAIFIMHTPVACKQHWLSYFLAGIFYLSAGVRQELSYLCALDCNTSSSLLKYRNWSSAMMIFWSVRHTALSQFTSLQHLSGFLLCLFRFHLSWWYSQWFPQYPLFLGDEFRIPGLNFKALLMYRSSSFKSLLV